MGCPGQGLAMNSMRSQLDVVQPVVQVSILYLCGSVSLANSCNFLQRVRAAVSALMCNRCANRTVACGFPLLYDMTEDHRMNTALMLLGSNKSLDNKKPLGSNNLWAFVYLWATHLQALNLWAATHLWAATNRWAATWLGQQKISWHQTSGQYPNLRAATTL